MKKYFFNDGSGQQGPFTLEDLKDKQLKAETPVWYEGLEQWTTAGKVEELKDLFNITPTPIITETKPEEKTTVPETTVASTAAAIATTTVVNPGPSAPAPTAKSTKQPQRGIAWVSWVLALLILGAAGYYVYQDMEKNKTASVTVDKTDSTVDTKTVKTGDNIIVTSPDSMPVSTRPEDTVATNSIPPVTVTTVTTNNTNDPLAVKKAADDKKKLLAKKKAEEDKKKQLALDAKKREEENKRIQAAAALTAKETEMRNNWPRYVTIGALKYEEHDGIKPFSIPLYNNMTANLEKVTLRVDYLKKEGKVVGTETLVLNNVPARGSSNVQASGNKKAKKANVYLTGINSRGMHFCYPLNNGNPADPYFCN